MAGLAHAAAVENPLIKADVIEATEFPELVQKYHVSGVPVTVISDVLQFVGAVPEKQFLDYLEAAAEKLRPQDQQPSEP